MAALTFSLVRAWPSASKHRSTSYLYCNQYDLATAGRGIQLEPLGPEQPNVRLFGVEHLTKQPWAGRHILETKPDVVVVETAVGPTHGAQTGRIFSCDGLLDSGPAAFVSQTVCGLVERMENSKEEEFPSFWKTLEANLPGEQLVYVAALRVGAELVFGDRPKSETFLQVAKQCSLKDLDKGFGEQARANYLDQISGGYIRQRNSDPSKMGAVERIMFLEREAILCQMIYESTQRLGSSGTVVGVVGAEHVNAMCDLWSSKRFLSVLERMQDRQSESDHDLENGVRHEENIGYKHAILESLVRLSASDQVLTDLKNEIGDVPEQYQNDYWFMLELYSSTRMLLATLSREELAQVCCGWQCDIWELLEKYRAARPANGAKVLDLDLITELRGLEVSVST